MTSDEENTPPTAKQGVRIADLPAGLNPSVRNLVTELDTDNDGFIDEEEILMTVNSLKASRKQNRNLLKIVGGLVGFGLLLAAAVLGISIAAAHLSKDTNVDSGGVLHDKRTGSVIKTSEALEWTPDRNVADMTNRELQNVKSIVLLDGDLHFQVKGFARVPSKADGDKKIILLVEGGSVTYDKDGMADATGDALALVNAAFGLPEDIGTDGSSGRKLQFVGITGIFILPIGIGWP